ncbi:MAG: YeeE/YedE family protein, partial [Thiomonas sp.]
MASALNSVSIAPTAQAPRRGLQQFASRLLLAAALAGFAAITWLVGWRQGLLWLIGLGYGVLLAAAAFGFTTGWRVWITR